MVSMDMVQRGINRYMEQEIISRLPEGSLGRFAANAAKYVFVARSGNAMNSLAENPIAKAFGLTADGQLDIDLAAEAARESIPENGLKVDVPVLGRMTFHRGDVDTLLRMIMEG